MTHEPKDHKSRGTLPGLVGSSDPKRGASLPSGKKK
jgi:hypothetical protein